VPDAEADANTTTMLGPVVAIFAITMLSAMPPLTKHIGVKGLALAGHRFFWLAIGLSVIFRLRGGRLSVRSIKLAWPAGLLFAANIAFFYTAVKITTVANATVIGAIQPVLSLLLVGPLFGERVHRSDVVITGGAIVGVSIVVYGSSITPVWSPMGDLLAVFAVLLWTAYLVVTKRARAELDAIELQTVLTIVATVVILPIALISGQSFAVPRADIGWLILLVLVPGVGHTLVNWVHNHTSLVMVSVLFLLNPVVATSLAALFLDEPLNGYQITGMVLVVASLAVLVARLQRRASLAS
jgi:drug/metabolite transporter (DMT)-like permease